MSASQESVLIVGGGIAGLCAATALAEKNYSVTVLEGRQVLGGRAYSFVDPQTQDSVDNGQHVFMGCYRETLSFLRRIRAERLLRIQPNLSVEFAGDRGRRARLRCWPLPSPLHLFSGLLGMSSLSWGDRLRLRHVYAALSDASQSPTVLDTMTIDQWLTRCNQSEAAKRHFWNLIAIAALNEDPSIAAATGFVQVLRQAFFAGRAAAGIGLATVGLSDLYVHSAVQYLKARGGEVLAKSPVQRLEFDGRRVRAVLLRDGRRFTADWVISAVPPGAFLRLLPAEAIEQEPVFQRIRKLRFAPIISIHLWFDRQISSKTFVGLLDTQVQWFFNKSKIYGRLARPGYVSVVISGAHAFIDWNEKKLLTMATEELRRLFPEARDALLLRSLVIKEHQATLSPVVGSDELRPGFLSPYPNLLIAGDWTRTGLPATIESACVSARTCAEIIATASSTGRNGQRSEGMPARKEIIHA